MTQGTRVAALVWTLLAVSGPAAAQQARPLPPEEVARAAIRADSAGDWATLLSLMHPEALARFRSIQIFQLRMLNRTDWPGLESLATDSNLQARWQRSRERQERYLLDSIYRVPSVDSLAHTSPDSIFARYSRAMRVDPSDSTLPPHYRPPATFTVVGAVKASDTLAYVVVDRPVEEPLGPMPDMFRDYPHETREAEVMVMRRLGKEWKSMLDGLDWRPVISADLVHEE